MVNNNLKTIPAYLSLYFFCTLVNLYTFLFLVKLHIRSNKHVYS